MDELIKRLIEERARVWEQAKALLDAADAEERDLTGEEAGDWKRLNEELDALDARIKELKELRERNKAADEQREQYEHIVRSERTEDPDGLTPDQRKIRQLASGEIRAAEFRFTPKDQRELRDILKSGSGANVVPTSFVNQLYAHLIENSAIRQTNVTVVTTDSGEDLQVPKTTAHSTAGIIAEGAAISESDPTFAQVTLQAYKYAFLTQVSGEMLTDTGVDLEAYLARQGGQALGNASGADFVAGTGTGEPNGVVTAATVGVTGGTGVGGAFTADELIALFYSVIAPYRRRATWMFSDAGLEDLRQLKDANNQYLWQPGLAIAEESTLMGRPIVADPDVPDPAINAKSVVFGDLSAYYIRDVNGVRVERSDDFAFNADLATFRFILRTDGDLVDTTGAVKVFQGAAT